MRIAKDEARAKLRLAELSSEQKQYFADLEREVERLQRRSYVHRKNIRSMQEKCRLLKLLERPTVINNLSPLPVRGLTMDDIAKRIAGMGRRAAR
jgi:hypothetical protein